jgi:hypothetical protein
MKTQISPVVAGVIVVVVLAVAFFFVYQQSGPAKASDVPRDMKKMMNPQKMAPPTNAQRPGGPPTGGANMPGGPGAPR